ncbi:MAG: GHKL domain-containing protein [Nitrospinae bacterium]|nr:GHKL domain-containing protein [Nitrospinota bacterium]
MEDSDTAVKAPRMLRGVGLKGKLIRVMIVVGALPLLLAMIFSYVQGNKSLKDVIGSSFKALAYETSTKIDFMLREEIKKNFRMVNHPTIILSIREQNRLDKILTESRGEDGFLENARAWGAQESRMNALLQSAASRLLSGFLEMDHNAAKSTHALYITNALGTLVASVNFFPPFLNRDNPSWKRAMQGGKDFAYIGDLQKDEKTQQSLLEIAIPIRSHDGETIGVFHRVFRAKDFFSTWIEPIMFGETGHVMLINSDGVVLDCPILPTGFKLADPELVRSVTGSEPNWAETQGDGHGSMELSIIGYSPLRETNAIIKQSGGREWFTFAWQSSDELFSPTNKLFLWISVAGVLSILLIVLMGSFASDKIVKPIRELQKTAGRIGRGEKVEKLSIGTGDEIEFLANEINTMNDLLAKAFSGLENQVREKTREARYLKEYTENVLMSVPDPILIFDEKCRVEYMNPAFARLACNNSSPVMGKTLEEGDLKYKEHWMRIGSELRGYSSGSSPALRQETRELAARPYTPRDPLAPAGAVSVAKSQTILNLGERVFVYQFFHVALEEGMTRSGLLMKEFTSEKRLQDQLAMAEKLSGLGRLSAGIAHEMNNPLYSIMGYIEAIIDEKDAAKIKVFARKVLDSSKHMAAIIQNLSGYTRSSIKDPPKDVNVNERLDASLEIALMASLTHGVELKKDYSPLPLVKARPEEIQQVFINVIANAVQAMEGTGRLTVSTESGGGNIVVKIQDSGPGIPPEYLSKIFDPFFTTKDQGKGSGLGLNIVHRIVEKYGGRIDVESRVGSGATFIITLPIQSVR